MSFCPQFFSLRNRRKLSRCWFAATMNERTFKKMFRPWTIAGTNLDNLCEEILQLARARGEGVSPRSSLYLSSQLMYGVVKILSYQVDYLERDLREAKKLLEEDNVEHRSAQELATGGVPLPETTAEQDFHNLELVQDQHLLRDESYSAAFESMMRDGDAQHFGMLTSQERDMLLTTDWEISIERLERLQLTEAEKTTTTTISVAQVSVERSDQVVETPGKHPATSPPIETPRKRTKLLEDPSTPVPEGLHQELLQEQVEEQVQAQVQQQVVEQVQEQVSQQQVQDEEQLLQEVEVEVGRTGHRGNGRRRRFRDQRTQLNPGRIQSWLSDTRIHTRPALYNRTRVQMRSAEALLGLPSTVFGGPRIRLWASVLLELFTDRTRQPLMEATLVSVEELRQEQRIPDQTAELTSRLEAAQITETFDEESKQLEHLPIPQHPPLAVEQDIPSAMELPDVTVPQETTMDEDSEDWLKPLFPDRDSLERARDRRRMGSPAFSTASSGVTICSSDLMASLSVLWRDRDAVAFKQLVPPGSYDQVDAGVAFQFLLECHTDGKLVLQQSGPYEEIWIRRRPRYSSSSG